MTEPTPALQLDTLFVTDGRRRIVATREPDPSPGPPFALVRGRLACAWAARADVPDPIAVELDQLAADEPPTAVWEQPLRHAHRYADLLGGRVRSGPAFAFPDDLGGPGDAVSNVVDEAELGRHFSGWVAGEIAAGRGPVVAVRDGGHPVAVCFCARRSAVAAEAGVETAASFRGRGYGPRAVAAWARRVRAAGLVPLYSTDWSNAASLAVARKLGLVRYAADFCVDP